MNRQWTLRTREGSGVTSAAVPASFVLQIPLEASASDLAPSSSDLLASLVRVGAVVGDQAPPALDLLQGDLIPPPSPPIPPTTLDGRPSSRDGKVGVGDLIFDHPPLAARNR